MPQGPGGILELARGVGRSAVAQLAGLVEHAAWWDSYWSDGAQVDLGPNHSELEAFYYGAHYMLGSFRWGRRRM